MEPSRSDLIEIFRALAHEVRLKLLVALGEGELTVSDLERRAGVAQPGLSQQLAVLRSANLLLTRRQGKAVYYRINIAVVGSLAEFLSQFEDVRPRSSEGTSSPSGTLGGGAAFAQILR